MNPSLDKLNLAVVRKMQVNTQRDGGIVNEYVPDYRLCRDCIVAPNLLY